MNVRSLLVVPRWGGGPRSDFYPWLEERLAAIAEAPSIKVLEMPSPGEPTIEGWVGALDAALPSDPALLARTVLLGHSVGCQAVLRCLARRSAPVAGVLLVAGWWTVDKPWPTLLPWIDVSFDVARARANAGKIVVVISDDDPFTSDTESNRSAWVDRTGAQVVVVQGAAHFNAPEQPAVLETLGSMLGVDHARRAPRS